MSIAGATDDRTTALMTAHTPEVPICSARGCHRDARHAVLWNNPKLHTPDRRKTWLACDEHEPTLREFLSLRGFWLETQPMS